MCWNVPQRVGAYEKTEEEGIVRGRTLSVAHKHLFKDAKG